MIYKYFILIGLLYSIPKVSYSQSYVGSEFPEIGHPVPDFQIKEVHNYNKRTLSNNDFLGQWLILDFWTRYCVNCIESFPKTNELQKEFSDRVRFVLIGQPHELIKPLYSKMEEKYKLNLVNAYDSSLFSRFGIQSVPHIIWVDPEGIVRAITTADAVTSENLQSFISGNNPDLRSKPNIDQEKRRNASYSRSIPLLLNDNGGADTSYIFRSVLAPWSDSVPITGVRFIGSHNRNRVQLTGFTLKSLYDVAYGDTMFHVPIDDRPNSYGRYYTHPIIEMTDTSDFKYDFNTGESIYSYSLIVPDSHANAQFLKDAMQRDLVTYFGHQVQVEEREMPYWSVTITDNKKQGLLSKGGAMRFEGDGFTSWAMYNAPIRYLIRTLWATYQNFPPFIDETGLKNNIDLKLETLIIDFDELREALEKKGITLVKKSRIMKVIVIKDKIK